MIILDEVTLAEVEHDLAWIAWPYARRLFTPKVRAELKKLIELRLVKLRIDDQFRANPMLDSNGILRLNVERIAPSSDA